MVGEARGILGLTRETKSPEMLPERYRFAAIEAYHNELLSESELAKFLRVDRLKARQMVQQHSQIRGLTESGDPETFELDMAQVVNQ